MIRIDNLSFAYSREMVLDNITSTFATGRIYGLLGANGVGKSTLFKILCGLLTTKHGSVSIDGFNPGNRQPSFLSKVFYVPEDFEGPDVTINAYANGIAPFYPNFDREMFEKLLADFEIDAKRKFTKLSLGQRKSHYVFKVHLSQIMRLLGFVTLLENIIQQIISLRMRIFKIRLNNNMVHKVVTKAKIWNWFIMLQHLLLKEVLAQSTVFNLLSV